MARPGSHAWEWGAVFQGGSAWPDPALSVGSISL